MRGYTDQTIDENGDLVFTLTEDGRSELAYQIEFHPGISDENLFIAMIEDHLENGFQFVEPEEVGALTSSLLLTDGHRDDDGEYEGDGSIWYFDRYMIDGYAETLANDGKIVFQNRGY
jgi:hypothetical protein